LLLNYGIGACVVLDIPKGVGCGLLFTGGLEEVLHVLLLVLIILGLNTLMEPIWVLDTRDRVHALLKSSRDCHNFHDSARDTLLIVVPVDDAAHVEICHRRILQPLAEELLFGCLFSIKYNSGYGAVSNLTLDWLFRNDELNIKTLIFNNFWAQDFGKAASTSNRSTLLLIVIL